MSTVRVIDTSGSEPVILELPEIIVRRLPVLATKLDTRVGSSSAGPGGPPGETAFPKEIDLASFGETREGFLIALNKISSTPFLKPCEEGAFARSRGALSVDTVR